MTVLREPVPYVRKAVNGTGYDVYTDPGWYVHGWGFNIQAPCQFRGWRVHSAKSGTVNLRLGLWVPGNATAVVTEDVSFNGPGLENVILSTAYDITLTHI